MNYVKTHAMYIVLIGLGLIGFHSWLTEHDSRVQAETTVRESVARVKDLQAQVVSISTQRDVKVAAIVAAAAKVKTPAQAITGIPEVSNVPLNARAVPDLPTAVTVEAQPLYAELAQCRVTEVKLNACEQTAQVNAQVVKEQVLQITALKKRPSFWRRVGGQVKTALIGGLVLEGIKIALGGRP